MTHLPLPIPDRDVTAQSFGDPAADLAAARYDTLETHLDRDSAAFWAWMRPGPKPCFTTELLSDILAQQALLRGALAPMRGPATSLPARWYVMGSRIPGIFNLGGDLGHFAEKIRARLQQGGLPLEWHAYPMEHSVCPEELKDIARWLHRVLAPVITGSG